MSHPSPERLSADVRLEVVVDVEPHVVVVRATLENRGERALYVFDRPTTYTREGLADDPGAPLRYLRGGCLRILYGEAPLPRRSLVSSRRVPHCTKVGPRATRALVARIPLPVMEHSSYWSVTAFAERPEATREALLEEAPFDAVAVLVDYLVEQPGLLPHDGLEGAVTFAANVDAFELGSRVIARVAVPRVGGWRRRDIDARVELPDEAPEPLEGDA